MPINFDKFKGAAKKNSFRFTILGVLLVAAMIVFMNLPGDMGTANVSASFGTPTDSSKAAMYSVGLGSSNTQRDDLAKWVDGAASETTIFEVDAKKNIESAIVWFMIDLDAMESSAYADWQHMVKFNMVIEINNLSVCNKEMVYLSHNTAYGNRIVGYYQLQNLGIDVDVADWIEVQVKMYCRLA